MKTNDLITRLSAIVRLLNSAKTRSLGVEDANTLLTDIQTEYEALKITRSAAGKMGGRPVGWSQSLGAYVGVDGRLPAVKPSKKAAKYVSPSYIKKAPTDRVETAEEARDRVTSNLRAVMNSAKKVSK